MFSEIKKYFSLVAIFIFASVLRFWYLGAQSLWIDEGFTINAAQGILKYGYPLLDSMQVYAGHQLNTYITALSMWSFDFDPFSPFSARLPAVIFGIFTVFTVYFVTFKFYKNRWLAFFAAFITAFSYWEIAWSRQARGYTAVQFFILLSIWFYWLWLENKKIKYLICAGLTFFAAYFSHAVAVIFLPAYFLSFVCYIILYREKKFPFRHLVVLFLFAVFLIFWTGLYQRILNVQTYDYSGAYFDFILKTIGVFSVGSLIGIAIGLMKKKTFWRTVFLANFLIFPFIAVVFYSKLGHHRYLFPLFVLMIILTVGILEFIWEKRLAKFIAPIILLVIAYPALNFAPKDFYKLEPRSPQPDFKTAYEIIAADKNENKIVLSDQAHMTKIYLGEPGYWLPISLTGRKSEIKEKIIETKNDRVEYYAAAKVLDNNVELIELIEKNSGYIIIDGLGSVRIAEELMSTIISHPRVKLLYRSGAEKNDEISLYRF